jgi:phenylacetate-coenzyme A ligase PaaK-like adenylate-forming protein
MRFAASIPRLRADFGAAERYLREWPPRDESRIAEMQLALLAPLWRDAVIDVPYYRDLVAAGKAPATISSWRDYFAIPLLERAALQAAPDRFARLSGPPDSYMQTAGSTGNPIRFGVWTDESRRQRVAKLATWIRCGYRLGDDIVLAWGHSHLLGTGMRRWVNHAKRVAKDRLAGYHRFDAYMLDEAACRAIGERIAHLRPAGVIGYSAALDLIARHARQLRNRIRAARVRFVMATAEPFPRDDTPERLRDLFGDSVLVEEFGGVEFGQVGVRFDQGEWLLFPDLGVAEAVAEGDPEGESLLVTPLHRRYTPLFRYRQGDLVREPRRLPTGQLAGFGALAGRAADMVAMPDGRSVHSVAFFHCIHQERAVRSIQMVLEDTGPRLKLVVDAAADAELEARIRQRLGQVHASLGKAPIERVHDVATNLAGKRRWYVDRRSRGDAKKSDGA